MFEAVGNQVDFAAMEKAVLEFWRESRAFEKSLENRKGGREYVFYDGPPFATGLPHYGHLLAGTIKDVIPRYRTMRGDHVRRTFGWDCHGLPVENEMEKELKLESRRDIEAYGIGKFNENCRSIVLRYTREWEEIVTRMGRWVDFRNGYRTMDRDFMESIWWVFKTLWDRNLIYEGYKILPYCPRCATPLSNFEANQGYAEVTDPAITVRFKLLDEDDTYFLAWTTTPWTLPSNLGLVAGPEIEYVKVKDGDVCYILAAERVAGYYPEAPEIVWRGKGRELENRRYEPLFGYFADRAAGGAVRMLLGDFVSTGDGTGIVHTAPGFGEDDNAVCKLYNIAEVCPIDKECRFTAEVSDYEGRFVKDCDKEIINHLKTEGKLVHRGQIKHNYPHCWRCDSALIYRAFPTWFVRIDEIKEKMIAANQKINWTPAHIKDGRFGKWLENARDWNIGRNRYWGTPLPVWRNDEGEILCVGSAAELEKLTGREVPDLHKHFVDAMEIPSPTGKSPLKRVPEVLDCWFESGSMPYAQRHYPFENKELFESTFPADFIAEGLDQTRGWFYTLVVLGAALFDCEPFKNVVVNGLVLAEDGQKMSKRKKNYPDPMEVVNAYGADAVRLFMLGSQVVRGEDLKFSENGVREILRNVMIPMWNALSFFVTYANVDGFTPLDDKAPERLANPLDRWILSSLAQMVGEVREELDNYNLQKAANRFSKFVDDLTNWYIRLSRRRFWKSRDDGDKMEAYATLYYVLVTFAKTAAPFIPFATEKIYRVLRQDDMPESVHLCDFPSPESVRDLALERQMELAMNVVSQGRFLRKQHNLKVRQPLARVIVVAPDAEAAELLAEAGWIIRDELNVKTLELSGDEDALVRRSAKANFKVLGGRLGKNMKEAAALIAAFDSAEVGAILKGSPRTIRLSDGSSAEIGEGDLLIQREERENMAVATGDGVTVALETALTDDLVDEGFARELVSKIQNMRKVEDFEVTDRIKVRYQVPEAMRRAVTEYAAYIAEEVLAVEFGAADLSGEAAIDVNDIVCKVTISKA